MWILRSCFHYGIYFLFVVFCCNWIVIRQNNDLLFNSVKEVPFRQYTLVLGTSKKGKHGMNPYFKYRIEAAAQLYHTGKTKYILLSGDNHTVSYNEPQDMKIYLMELGVPESAIILDYAGFRTLDSVVRAQKVFNCNELIIVSQPFHNQRAVFIAKHYGIDAVAYNARDVQRRFNLPPIREYLAKVAVIIDLYLLQTEPKFPSHI